MTNDNSSATKDPTEKHTKPPFPEQSQPEPGLDKEMTPTPTSSEEEYRSSNRLEGRKALVTGGDSGIGAAVAIAFAKEGATVAISYLPDEQEDADRVIKTIEDEGGKACAIPGDLTDESFARKLVHDAAKQLGGLDIIVNNAGKQVYINDITEISTEQLQDTFTVNIFAMFWIVQEAMQYLKPGSTIINTTSEQATQPSPGLLDYAATKGAITNFTRGLSQQLTPKGIRVNAVAPGPVWTPLQPSHGQPQEKIKKFGGNTPMGRPGQPSELAGAYVFLASEEASFVSGEVIGVTGGKLR